ncbi:glycoside hydrolase [Gloeopeniophorella convolvens]|nr:glycoside hydrolase [Gloeopeniophorella convolvens]
MNKVKTFLKEHLHAMDHPHVEQDPHLLTAAQNSAPCDFPTEQDLFRYRKQRGVNLGCWFVLERWIADYPFQGAASPGQSDHDVARGPNGRSILEAHWDAWVQEDDWKWIAERGLNAVRIPIGFYHLCGADPLVLKGTDFEDMEDVFRGAWPRITSAITNAYKYGVGVLIDLHAAPGKQNADSHSGTSSNKIAFFESRNLSHTTYILTSLLTHLTEFTTKHNPPLPNIIGIELVNEPNPPGGDHKGLQRWYHNTIQSLRGIDANIPLYIGDAWQTEGYANFIKGSNQQLPHSSPSPIALDHHLYRCFTPSDSRITASQHAQALKDPVSGAASRFSQLASTLTEAGADLVVGEWSAALNPGSLQDVQDESAAKRSFVDAQLWLYDKFCAGWFWWTFKKQWGGDNGWGLRDAVATGVFPDWTGLRDRDRISLGKEERDQRMNQERALALCSSVVLAYAYIYMRAGT